MSENSLNRTAQIHGTGVFVGSTHTYNGFTVGTSIYVPQSYSPDKEYAFLLYFHSAGDRGDGPLWNGSIGSNNSMPKDVIERYGEDFIIFAPRCPSGSQWVASPWDPGVYNYKSTPVSKPMSAVIDFIYNEILKNYSIDRSRIYVAGDSMGGGGTWDIILREKDLFAAALPTCGYNDPAEAANIRGDLAIWSHHAKQDPVVSVLGDQKMYAALTELGRTNVKYTEFDTENPNDAALFYSTGPSWAHYAWEAVHANADEVISWLVSQKKQI